MSFVVMVLRFHGGGRKRIGVPSGLNGGKAKCFALTSQWLWYRGCTVLRIAKIVFLLERFMLRSARNLSDNRSSVAEYISSWALP